MAEKQKEPTQNVCRNYLVLYSKQVKCSISNVEDMHAFRDCIGYGKAKIIAYYFLDEQDGITDVVFDLRDVHKKYIGKKGMSYRDFIFKLCPMVPESFVLEDFVDALDDKILTIACVIAGNNLHDYGPYQPWGYHTRKMLEALDKHFGHHLALDRFKDWDITRKLIKFYIFAEIVALVVHFAVFAAGVTLIVLGVTNVMPLWLGLLLGILPTLIGGLFFILQLVWRLRGDVQKKFDKKELDKEEFYHLATSSRIR